MKRALLALLFVIGCGRGDEKSLRRVVEARFKHYEGSRDRLSMDCRITEFPLPERPWFRVKFKLYPEQSVPPYGVCTVRFDLDIGHGQRQLATRDVRYVYVEGSWIHFRDDPVTFG